MVETSNSTYYETIAKRNAQLAGALVTEVDARVRGGLMTTCEFAGNEHSPKKMRKCKHYTKASRHNRCMHYREEMNGACDCGK
jgi:hypothetical protein